MAIPERHLGLHMPGDESVPAGLVDALADLVSTHVDLDAVLALAAEASPPADADAEAAPPAPPAPPQGPPVRIAVARDAAFCFYYHDNLALLRAAGAELVPFSPLVEGLPADVAGVYLGGGYPERCVACGTCLRCHALRRVALCSAAAPHAHNLALVPPVLAGTPRTWLTTGRCAPAWRRLRAPAAWCTPSAAACCTCPSRYSRTRTGPHTPWVRAGAGRGAGLSSAPAAPGLACHAWRPPSPPPPPPPLPWPAPRSRRVPVPRGHAWGQDEHGLRGGGGAGGVPPVPARRARARPGAPLL